MKWFMACEFIPRVCVGEGIQFTAGHLLLTQVTLVEVESILARTGVPEELGGWGRHGPSTGARAPDILCLPVEGPSGPLWVLKTVGAIWTRGCGSL